MSKFANVSDTQNSQSMSIESLTDNDNKEIEELMISNTDNDDEADEDSEEGESSDEEEIIS